MKKIIAKNIQWDIDVEDVYDILNDLSYESAANLLDIPAKKYANMTTDEIYDYVYDCRDNVIDAVREYLGLPEQAEIPDDLEIEYPTLDNLDAITEWLSDEYGYCILGYQLEEGE